MDSVIWLSYQYCVQNWKISFDNCRGNGPDVNPSGYQDFNHWGRLRGDSNLARLSCIAYPAGRSAFNPIEHAWFPLSIALTGVTLPANKPTFVIRSGNWKKHKCLILPPQISKILEQYKLWCQCCCSYCHTRSRRRIYL